MDRPECKAGVRAVSALGRLAGRFARERRGVAAIEFAILAFPFFLLIFAILECCIAFVAQELMSNAVDDVARLLRTGQLKPDDIDREEMRDALCDRMGVLFPGGCPEMQIDLRSFTTIDSASRVFDSGVVPAEYRFDPGPASSANVLRVFYPWPVITDILRERISSPDGKWLLFATATWQNEPFDD
ncbi:pilus assembly protein [Chelativorans sp. SCAU2101]|uniref:Pilus assembly protein n=1 Tax=Chelativorans petroleitrophicus TaxID=2975484 RepID=A0A9X2X7E7_9HYPH|nr:TadE/TadG family type IV pilus assembly protein [Chelativorans petroleitrophicus]MCT8990013.1 pilus assembly protein [Chelativorans petroleitrophicus]